MADGYGTLENLVMQSAFWAGKTVFLTGHTGFKGSWLTLWLQMLGANVVGFALPPATEPSLWSLIGNADEVTSLEGNICDQAALQHAVSTHQPDVIIHMAAQALVRESYVNPVETYATNVMGTVNLLEAARQIDSVRAILVVTTDKCYENREWVWGYREEDPLGGFDPYSSSKACAELITAAYRRSFFDSEQGSLSVATARAGNVIGGGDWSHDRLLPDIVRSVLAQQPVVLRNPLATRPWQHVLEPLTGYLMLAEALYEEGQQFASSWNFGPDDHSVQSVAWVTEQLLNEWARSRSTPIDGWVADPNHNPHEAQSLKLDSSKARVELGWQPKLELAQALGWIIEWTDAWQAHEDMRQVSINQIMRYMELGNSQ